MAFETKGWTGLAWLSGGGRHRRYAARMSEMEAMITTPRASRRRTRAPWVIGVAMVLVGGFAGPASAHGDIASSTPEAGAKVKKPPRRVSLVLAEAPAKGSTVTVTDGCGDEVSGEPQLNGDTIAVATDGDRPGRWKVQLRSISSVDGHAITDRFAFQVAGRRDCSDEVEEPEDDVEEPDTSSRPPIENDDDGSGFPVVPFALGTVAVIGVAVALRGPRKKS